MRVVELGSASLPVMRRLLDLFEAAFGDERTHGGTPGDGHLQAVLDDPRFIALAAVSGDEVVGGLTAYHLVKPERLAGEVYLYDLAVAPAHRRRGVASALVTHLGAKAATLGATLFVQADADDAATVALYARFGRPRQVLHFDLAPA